jgi:hypothetical protein
VAVGGWGEAYRIGWPIQYNNLIQPASSFPSIISRNKFAKLKFLWLQFFHYPIFCPFALFQHFPPPIERMTKINYSGLFVAANNFHLLAGNTQIGPKNI